MALARFSTAFQVLSLSRDPATSFYFSVSVSPLGSQRLRRSTPGTWRRVASAVEPADEVLLPAAEGDRVEYDWREEWYPLYLSDEVPKDAPLGLQVFDKKLVLYRDGNGSFCCFEDRCPHRFGVQFFFFIFPSWIPNLVDFSYFLGCFCCNLCRVLSTYRQINRLSKSCYLVMLGWEIIQSNYISKQIHLNCGNLVYKIDRLQPTFYALKKKIEIF